MKAAAALGSVDRIGLDAILLYSNRSDVVNSFQVIKLLFLLFEWLPGLALGIALLTGLITMPVHAGSRRRRIWAAHTLESSGIMLLLASLLLCGYVQFFLSARLYPLTVTIPLPESLILQYARDCLYSVMILSSISGFGLLAAGQSLGNPARATLRSGLLSNRHAAPLQGQSAALPAFLLIWAMALVLLAGSFAFVRDFRAQGLEPVAEKLLHPNRKTQVITAADQNLYLLQLVVQEDTGLPASNIQVHITGHGTQSEAEYQIELQTDEQGKARLYLDQGTYRLYFPFELFPDAYELPSSFFFDLNTPGITRLDIVLHKKPPVQDMLLPETAVSSNLGNE